jgi:hypothetical protein
MSLVRAIRSGGVEFCTGTGQEGNPTQPRTFSLNLQGTVCKTMPVARILKVGGTRSPRGAMPLAIAARMTTPQTEELTMKTKLRYVAPLLATLVVSGAIGLAPVASAGPGAAAGSRAALQTTVGPNPPDPHIFVPSPYRSAEDPLVPNPQGANPFFPFYPGYDLPS